MKGERAQPWENCMRSMQTWQLLQVWLAGWLHAAMPECVPLLKSPPISDCHILSALSEGVSWVLSQSRPYMRVFAHYGTSLQDMYVARMLMLAPSWHGFDRPAAVHAPVRIFSVVHTHPPTHTHTHTHTHRRYQEGRSGRCGERPPRA